jgi:hypothetical protein
MPSARRTIVVDRPVDEVFTSVQTAMYGEIAGLDTAKELLESTP